MELQRSGHESGQFYFSSGTMRENMGLEILCLILGEEKSTTYGAVVAVILECTRKAMAFDERRKKSGKAWYLYWPH